MGKSNKKAIGGLVFGVGLIVLLIGAMTDVYATTTGVIVALAVWIIGGAFVALLSGGGDQTPKPPEQPEQSQPPEQPEQTQPLEQMERLEQPQE